MPSHESDRQRTSGDSDHDGGNVDVGPIASLSPMTIADGSDDDIANADLEDPLIQTRTYPTTDAASSSPRRDRRRKSFTNMSWLRLSSCSDNKQSNRGVYLICALITLCLTCILIATLIHTVYTKSAPSLPPLPPYLPLYNLGEATLPRHWTLSDDDIQSHQLAKWRVPDGTKVVGIVFYGRRRTASLLNCYLERNLKRNGGMLDEVVWMQGTSKPDEVEWMTYVVNSTDNYRSWYNHDFAKHRLYNPAYSVIFDEQYNGPVVYVKIDDDIVFMEDIAITAIVHRLLTDAHRPLLVGANVVNQAALSWVHYSMAAIDSYLPELSTFPNVADTFSWFFSSDKSKTNEIDANVQEPYWHGPAGFRVSKQFSAPPSDTPGQNTHRWLPLDPKGAMTIDSTPIAIDPTFDPFGDALMWWPIGAQQHYSFLGRLRANTIDALKFNVWDFNYVRMGIQFYAIKRGDLLERFPFPIEDDEKYLSTQATRQSHRRGYVDGRNIVAHYSYGPQLSGMDTTDILMRYRAFAEQNICISLDALQYADSL